MLGFSERNLELIRHRHEHYSYAIGKQAIAQLPAELSQVPWGHHTVILSKVKSPDAARFYMQQTVQNGWSRNILSIHIERDEYGRRGKAITNF